MTTPLHALSPRVFAQQIARHFSQQTSWNGGLRFCEPDESVPSNVYACDLPKRAHRLTPAVSVVLEVASQPDGMAVTRGINLACRSRSPSYDEAYLLLSNLLGTLLPSGQPFVFQQPVIGSINTNMVPGLPVIGDMDTVNLWRVIELTPASAIVPVPGGGTAGRTEEGEHQCRLDFAATCAPLTIEGAGLQAG